MPYAHYLETLLASPWLIALIAFAGCFITLEALKKIIHSQLKKFASRTTTKWDDVAVDILGRTRWWFLASLAAHFVLSFMELHTQWDDKMASASLIITFVQCSIWGHAAINYMMDDYFGSRGSNDPAVASSASLIKLVLNVIFYSTAFLLLLHNLGFNVTTLLAGLGVGGVAVALAVQNILGDLFASFSIILDKPFVVGDFIDLTDAKGHVEHIGLKTTRLRSISGEEVVVGNSDLLKAKLHNFRRMDRRRVLHRFGLVYGTPFDKIEIIPEMIYDIVSKDPDLTVDRVHFCGYGAYSLDFELVYWINNRDYNIHMDKQQRILIEIGRRFESQGLEFAFPTQTVLIPKTASN